MASSMQLIKAIPPFPPDVLEDGSTQYELRAPASATAGKEHEFEIT